MIQVIQLKGILSPFMHIVWTAVAGGALWNSPWQLPFMGKYIICGLLFWIIALSILNLGIKQITQEKEGKKIF